MDKTAHTGADERPQPAIEKDSRMMQRAKGGSQDFRSHAKTGGRSSKPEVLGPAEGGMVGRVLWVTTDTRAHTKVVEIVEKIADVPQAIQLECIMIF